MSSPSPSPPPPFGDGGGRGDNPDDGDDASFGSSSEDYEYENSDDDDGNNSGYYEYPADEELRKLDERKHQASLFNQEPVPCPICCDDRVEEGCAMTLPACSHSFCVECFARYVEVEIGNGNADSITCPCILESGSGGGGSSNDCNSSSNTKSAEDGGRNNSNNNFRRCGAPVSMEVLHEIMSKESYDRLARHVDAAFVRKNVDYHHCPTPDCSNIVLCRVAFDSNRDRDDMDEGRGDEEAPARICDCFRCGRTSCLTCGASPFHASRTCREHREEQIRKRAEMERLEAGRRRAEFSMMAYGVDRSRAGEEARYDFNVDGRDLGLAGDAGGDDGGSAAGVEHAAAAEGEGGGSALSGIKRCRRCGNGVELREGCLKMKCLCGYRFCYECGSENAQCDCTPSHHGFADNVTGGGDFWGLEESTSYT